MEERKHDELVSTDLLLHVREARQHSDVIEVESSAEEEPRAENENGKENNHCPGGIRRDYHIIRHVRRHARETCILNWWKVKINERKQVFTKSTSEKPLNLKGRPLERSTLEINIGPYDNN